MFIVPLDAPGVTIRPVFTFAGWRTNETFFDEVRVPGDALIGEVNRGWYIAPNAPGLRESIDRGIQSSRTGSGVIAGYTVLYEGAQRNRAVAIIDLDLERRTVASTADAAMMAEMESAIESVGRGVSVDGGKFSLRNYLRRPASAIPSASRLPQLRTRNKTGQALLKHSG